MNNPIPIPIMPNFTKILRQLRKDHNLTQNEAADAFTMSYSTLQRSEAGQRVLTYPELERIASYCKKDINEILQLDDEFKGPIVQATLPEKEWPYEKIIMVQNEQITALLGEIRNVYTVVTKLISKDVV